MIAPTERGRDYLFSHARSSRWYREPPPSGRAPANELGRGTADRWRGGDELEEMGSRRTDGQGEFLPRKSALLVGTKLVFTFILFWFIFCQI